MLIRARRATAIVAVFALMSIVSGCDLWRLALGTDPGGSTTALQIISPGKATQVAGQPNVPVEIRISDQITRSTLLVTLRTGPGLTTAISLGSRLTFTGDRARGTVALSELQEGISTITASGRVGSGPRQEVDTAFSYEPRLAVADGSRCDVLGQSRCALPFPNDRWTRSSGSTDTGLLVDIQPGTFPANSAGTPFDPTEWNRNDGFSPGSPLVTHFPGVDLAQSNLPTIGTMGDYADADAGVVVIDTTTGERWPVWTELDAWATSNATRALIIRPTRNFLEGHRYVVGLRHLRNAAGALLPVSREFQVLRDLIPTFISTVDGRSFHLADAISALDHAGVESDSLNLAWEFTVASERNLSERVLRMRDDAYTQLGTAQPAFTVTSVTDDVSSSVWRRVQGTFDVPLYLTGTGQPGSRLNNGPDGLPRRNGTWKANFICNIPRSVYSGAGSTVTPGRGLVYGHGLLGGAGEVNSFGPLHNTHRIVGCATDWIGMASGDVGNVAQILQDLSKFPSLPDRLQQSLINFQFLAKLMKDGGFGTHAAFRAGPNAGATIQTGAVFFNGNSQGGITGGAATAISKEWTRAALGVPAINYATLLTRSIHWDTFSPPLYSNYPDEIVRTIAYTLIQMLWDRGEGNGYAQHLTTDPLPGTPAHRVLLIEAFGDHQVANVATETEARTIGARLWSPALEPGRTDLAEPFFGLTPVPSTPYRGSVLVVWDYGTPAPPQPNLPPRPPAYGDDPHGAGSREPRVGQQVSDFLQVGGSFVDHCGGGPCTSDA